VLCTLFPPSQFGLLMSKIPFIICFFIDLKNKSTFYLKKIML
jgi:hypothetical protein